MMLIYEDKSGKSQCCGLVLLANSGAQDSHVLVALLMGDLKFSLALRAELVKLAELSDFLAS